MDLFNLSYGDFEHFIFVLVRVGAFIVFVPILGSQQVPARVKIGLALLLSLMTFPLISGMPLPQSKGALDLSLYLFAETLVGLTLAFAVRTQKLSVFGKVSNVTVATLPLKICHAKRPE